MAKSQKVKTYFSITKANVKQSAYLLVSNREVPPNRNDEGTLTIALEDLEAATKAAAWTTLAAAKKAAATSVGRSRLTWEDHAEDAEGITAWTTTYEEKVTL